MIKSNPYCVIERVFVNPGKGSAFVRCKLKNLLNGSVLRETIRTNDTVVEAEISDRDAQYLYKEKTEYLFMDMENYEQFPIPEKILDTKKHFILEGQSYRIIYWNNNPIDLTLPPKVTLTVTEAPEGVKGDTATGATKTIVCETSLSLQAPLFIKAGEKIIVNTDSGEYVERVT